jgi:hypothetical protein
VPTRKASHPAPWFRPSHTSFAESRTAFFSVGTVHHSYHVVIFRGDYRFNPGNWSQTQARQHHVLFVSASSGKDRYSIYILRPIHKRKSECSGTIGELRAGPWG